MLKGNSLRIGILRARECLRTEFYVIEHEKGICLDKIEHVA